jgi:diadenosine tetraphosphate (Ap4A) HIT family hydrolase
VSDNWQQLRAGKDCPFDSPRPESNRYRDKIETLTTSTLYLERDQTYRGYCLLIFDPRHSTRPDELSREEWSSFCADALAAERAIVQALSPDHVNLELLGNTMPHLHWHIIPRYEKDPRWGGPIWTTRAEEMTRHELGDDERQELIGQLQQLIRG